MNEALAAIYARIPALDCQGLCARSCGPVFAEVAEAEAAGARYGLVSRAEVAALGGGAHPHTLPGNDALALFATDRKLRCHLLHLGRCTVYDNRPGLCRLWGVVESMPCHMGCIPERWLAAAEGHEILAAIREACAP